MPATLDDQAIFDAARQIASPEARQAFLLEKCVGHPELLQQIQKMLKAWEEHASFLETPLAEVTRASIQSMPDQYQSGSIIGQYKLMEKLGEGGMGTVWIAERHQPKQRVALKLIKPGMDSVSVLRRFDAERQALALMSHNNIAKMLDAGTSESGRPYFVMEFVKGVPITKYCDEVQATIRERLELFIPVCQAIQHAHQKGIIHRDIKPSNVLVCIEDGKPVPKVIDFGVAKALHQPLTKDSLHTNFNQIVGTLEYMSPEQAELNALDIDTRADIYALGVLLYELLTGSTPLTRIQLMESANLEILRLIKEEEPQKPSTRLSDSGEALASISAQRSMEPAKLSKLVRGELDWIVMKTLEKDRNRRYETANGLAVELQRYLADEPVQACPPSKWYRVRKFVQRNQGPVLAVSLIFMALVLGIIGTSFGLYEANNQRDRAKVAEQETQKQADELKLISDFQGKMLEQIDPTEAGIRLTSYVKTKFLESLSKSKLSEAEQVHQVQQFASNWNLINATDAARELIDFSLFKPAVTAIEKEFKDKPLLDAQLSQVLAVRYRTLGLGDFAKPLHERALALRRQVLGEEHPKTLESISELAVYLLDSGLYSNAESLFRRVFEIRRHVLGLEHRDTLESMNNLGASLLNQHKLTEAEKLLHEASIIKRRVLGETDRSTLSTLNNLAAVMYRQGKFGEAELLYRECLESKRKVLGELHRETLTSLSNLGFILEQQFRLNEAEPIYRECLEKTRKVRGELHPATITLTNNLGVLLVRQAKFEEAEKYQREALKLRRQVLGENHPDTIQSTMNLGDLFHGQGRMEEGEIYLRNAVVKYRQVLGIEHPQSLISCILLGGLLESRKKHAEVVDLLTTIEAATRKTHVGDNTFMLAQLLRPLGKSRAGLGNFADAEANLIEAHSIYVKTRGPKNKARRDCMEAIIDLYTAWHAAQPGKGYDTKAADWKTKLAALPPAATNRTPEKAK